MRQPLFVFVAAAIISTLVGCQSSIYVPSEKNKKGYILEEGADAWLVYISHDLPKVQAATEKGVKNLGLVKVNTKADKVTGLTTAEFADGEKVSVRLERVTDELTSMYIEVGALNPPKKVKAIFQSIEKEL